MRAVPGAISTPASAAPAPARGKFGRSRPLPASSPQMQHQLRAAARAGPHLTHLPTGPGRGFLGSGGRGSCARISGSGGLWCSALASASSSTGVGGVAWGTVRRGGAGPGGRSAEARAPGARRAELVDTAAAGAPQASPHARRHLANSAAAPAVKASAATGSWAPPEAGSCGWRDAVQTPVSSSARPAPRSSPLRSGGGRGSRRPGSADRAAAAASSRPWRPPSWEPGHKPHPPPPTSGCCSLRRPRTTLVPTSGSAPESCARGLRRPR